LVRLARAHRSCGRLRSLVGPRAAFGLAAVAATVTLTACDKPKPPAPTAGATSSANAAASAAILAKTQAVPLMTGKPKTPPDSISAGFTSTCAHFPDGSAMCWGRVGAWIDDDKPVWVQGLFGSKNISVSGYPIWAVMNDGRLTCWADDKTDRGCGWGAASPAKPGVYGLAGVAEIAASSGHGCARFTSGGVVCWGKNQLGQAGTGVASDAEVAPRDIVFTDAIGVAANQGRSCAVQKGGTVSCWGRKMDKTLVEPGKPPPPDGPHDAKPTLVPGLAGVEQIGLGEEHACARNTDGTVRCWGVNSEGQLGDGGKAGRVVPAPVRGITDAVDLAVGSYHTCALTRAGKVKCWGRNWHGELGDGTTISRNTPVEVGVIGRSTQIAAGGGHSCALARDGEMHCWGANREGQLGDATRASTGAPTTVAF
jgi:hypothetical protein